MKTLIIHPEDSSTFFLDIVYNPIEDKTVITKNVSKKELSDLIEKHDRIMMMGHGTPSGLLAVGQFGQYVNYIIDSSFVPQLKERDNNVFIWCNADRFVNAWGLKGFYSGMFISEIGEAFFCGLPNTPQDIVDESNYGFCNIMAKYINEDTQKIYDNVKNDYGLIAETNPVALYNHIRLYKK